MSSSDAFLRAEPRHLAALVAVHETSSFRDAALRLRCAQSAISQRVAQLESFARMQLVERSSSQSPLRLTEAGEILVEHARTVLGELDAAAADIRAMDRSRPPALSIGTFESVSSSLIPRAIRRLRATDPELTVTLRESPEWHDFFPCVASGQLDAAFADLPLDPGPFMFQELLVDPCVLIVPAGSPLARRREPPTLAEIAAQPLIEPSWPMTALLTEHLRTAGVEPRFVVRAELNASVQSLVAQGLGVALQPRLSADPTDPRTTVILLDDVLPPRRIALYWHRERRHDVAIQQFLGALLDDRASGEPSAQAAEPAQAA